MYLPYAPEQTLRRALFRGVLGRPSHQISSSGLEAMGIPNPQRYFQIGT